MAVALRTSQAVASLLRSRREELGLSLRQVQQRTAEAGELIPFPTLARVEQGKVDPGVRRLHLLLRLYEISPQVVADLIELEDLAGRLPKTQDARMLHDDGIDHWKRGEPGKAIACLIALQALLKDRPEETSFRQKATVSFAIVAASLGKYHAALDLVSRVLVERPERSVLVSALIQAGACWKALGSWDVALALLARAEEHVAAGEHKERAWVLHLKASVLSMMEKFDDADAAASRAIAAYRKAGDPFGESTALAVRIGIFTKKGDGRRALAAAREARGHAKRHGYRRLECLRTIDEAQALLLLGDPEKALPHLRRALGESVTSGDRHAEFHAHHALWKAYSALEQREQAAFELGAARHYVHFVDETSGEVEEIRSLPIERPAKRRGRPPSAARISPR